MDEDGAFGLEPPPWRPLPFNVQSFPPKEKPAVMKELERISKRMDEDANTAVTDDVVYRSTIVVDSCVTHVKAGMKTLIGRIRQRFPRHVRLTANGWVDKVVEVTGSRMHKYLVKLFAPASIEDPDDADFPADPSAPSPPPPPPASPVDPLYQLEGIALLAVQGNPKLGRLLNKKTRISVEDLEDLVDGCPDMDAERGPGIYAIWLKHGRDFWFRLGQSVDLVKRASDYRIINENPTSMADKMMKLARDTDAVAQGNFGMVRLMPLPEECPHTMLEPIETVYMFALDLGTQKGDAPPPVDPKSAWSPPISANDHVLTIAESHARKMTIMQWTYAYMIWVAALEAAWRQDEVVLPGYQVAPVDQDYRAKVIEQYDILWDQVIEDSQFDNAEDFLIYFFGGISSGQPSIVRLLLHFWPPNIFGLSDWTMRIGNERNIRQGTHAQLPEWHDNALADLIEQLYDDHERDDLSGRAGVPASETLPLA